MATTKAAQQGAQQPAQDEPARKPAPIIQLNPSRMQDAEFTREVKTVTAEAGIEPRDLERQDYWAHVGQNLKPWTRIEVKADDGTWFADCIVLAAGRNWANVKVLQAFDLTSADVDRTRASQVEEYLGLPYEVRYRGEHELWGVLRKSDNAIMHTGAQTKGEADTWLRERLKADK